jgi:hypothetical protein
MNLLNRRMLQRALIGLAVVFNGVIHAHAFEGKWENSAYMSVAATIVKDGGGYSVKLETSTKGCGGEVEGKATAEGDVLTLSAPNDDATYGKACIVTLTKKGKRLVMEEVEGCLFWHGAACEFAGTMKKKK